MAGFIAFHAFQTLSAGSMHSVWALLGWLRKSTGAEHYGCMETSRTNRSLVTDCAPTVQHMLEINPVASLQHGMAHRDEAILCAQIAHQAVHSICIGRDAAKYTLLSMSVFVAEVLWSLPVLYSNWYHNNGNSCVPT